MYKEIWGTRRKFLRMYKCTWVFLSIFAKLHFDSNFFLDELIELKKCSHVAKTKKQLLIFSTVG